MKQRYKETTTKQKIAKKTNGSIVLVSQFKEEGVCSSIKREENARSHSLCGDFFLSSPRFYRVSLTMYAGDERLQRKERNCTESLRSFFLTPNYSRIGSLFVRDRKVVRLLTIVSFNRSAAFHRILLRT